jgi:hypothetical protein
LKRHKYKLIRKIAIVWGARVACRLRTKFKL